MHIKTQPMEFERLKNLSLGDLELLREHQYNILRFTVAYEAMLIQEKGLKYVEDTRNTALDKLIVIREILTERYDTDTSTT